MNDAEVSQRRTDVYKEKARTKQHLEEFMIGISIMALLGCSTRRKAASGGAVPEGTASTEGMTTMLNRIGAVFFVYDHDDRYYVIGSTDMARGFEESGHLPYTRPLSDLRRGPDRPISAWATWQRRGMIRCPAPPSRLPSRSGPSCGPVRCAAWRPGVPALKAGSGRCHRRPQAK